MPLAVVRSRGLLAMSAPEVRVEVHLANGLPAFNIVGLPQAEVRESRERVRAALQNLDFEFPNRRITVNLAPADLPKESGRFDLPIALGILGATGQIDPSLLRKIEAVGELSLTGEVRPIRGAVAMALAVRRAGQNHALLLPRANAEEAALIGGVSLCGIGRLDELRKPADIRRREPTRRAANAVTAASAVTHCSAANPCATPSGSARSADWYDGVDFSQVIGHTIARRMLEIAAAGEHSALLIGPPGAGKSMLAQRLPTILPPLDDEEAAEVAAVASLCGSFSPAQWGRRPYRAPHHTSSAPALVGGGSNPRPGEISLGHLGAVFLDELPEFARPVLEALREPLESGRITLSRALHHVDFPARFQFIGAMNPCPCGYLGQTNSHCRCTPDQVQRYRHRLSGPLLDRIDLRLEVEAQSSEALLAAHDGTSQSRAARSESSADIRARVIAARQRAMKRQGQPNARAQGDALNELHGSTEPAARHLLQQAAGRLSLSARAVTRTLQVARTIADLAGQDRIASNHVAEALQFRRAMSGN